MITVEQRPLTLTPVNVEHIYTFSSTNVGQTDYRFVIDVYKDATTTPEKVGRLFVAPNTYAKGIINVDNIVYNLVEGNARADEPQYTSQTTTGTTSYGLLTNVKGVANSNAFNDNTEYNQQFHVRDYRLMVGEQFLSGDTTVTYISTDVTTPGSTFYCEVDYTLLNPFGDVNWYAAGGNIVEGSVLQQGVNVNWYRLGGTIANYDSYEVDGSVRFVNITGGTPTVGDIVEVTELYSGIIYQFAYFGAYGPYETEHWEFVSIVYPEGDYLPYYSPPAVTIWPGTSLKEGSYNPYVYNAPYWDTTSPKEQQDFWEVKKYRMSGTTVNEQEPSLFLTTAGNSEYSIDESTPGITTDRARRRRHHPSCPILVSWFNGILSQNTDFYFVNPLATVVMSTGATQNGEYGPAYEYRINGDTFTGMTPQNDRILYYNTIVPNLAGGKVCFWTAGSEGEYQYDGYGYSEVLEYYLEEDDCLSDPVHVLFLNRQGVWDTYTLDRKALETKAIERQVYAKGGIANTSIYSQLSTNRRKTVYNQNITETMVVNTWFLTDNDKQIVEDLFMSPEVYIIKDHDWTGKGEKTYNPYLLPVVLNMDTLQEYKNIYNKQVQYEFVLEYTPINLYKTQG